MSLDVSIPEALIKNAIAVAIAETFSPEKKDALIRDVVRAHLQYKENSYDKETILSKKVGEFIRRIALEEVGNVLDTMRPDVERIVQETLGPQFKDSVFANLKRGLQSVIVRNISVEVVLDR